jgi:hypothetical protein
MKRSLVLLGLATLLVTGSSQSYAGVTTRYAFKSGNWKGTSYYTNGRFTHCQMSASYRNGSKLIFGLETNRSMSVGIINKRWNLTPGEREEVRISVDGRTALWSTAKVLRTYHIATFFKANSRIYTMLRRGRGMVISAGGTRLSYSLRGTSRALIRLLDCTVAGSRENRRLAAAPPALLDSPPVRRPPPIRDNPPPPKRLASNKFKIGNWRGSDYYSKKNGRFTHCAMSVKYKNGTKLIIGLERNKAMSIGITHPDWNMPKNGRVNVDFSVDNRKILTATAKVISPTHFAAFFPTNRELFKSMQNGRTLAVTSPGVNLKYDLTDADRALTALLRCTVNSVEAENGVTGGNRSAPPSPFGAPGRKAAPPSPFGGKAKPGPANPFDAPPGKSPGNPFSATEAPPPPRNAPPPAPRGGASAVERLERSEAIVFISNILARANVGDYQLQPENKSLLPGYYINWTTGSGLLGGLNGFTGAAENFVVSNTSRIIADGAIKCDGRFASGVRFSKKDENRIVKRVFTACDRSSGAVDENLYTIIRYPSGHAYVITHRISKPSAKEAAQSMDNQIFDVILRTTSG